MKNDIMGCLEVRYQRSIDALTLDYRRPQPHPLHPRSVLSLSLSLLTVHFKRRKTVWRERVGVLGSEMKVGGGKGERRECADQ